MLLAAIIIWYVKTFSQENCEVHVRLWLCVQAGISLASVIADLLFIWTIACKSIEQNEKECIYTLEAVYYTLYINGQMIWLVLGNLGHFNLQESHCDFDYDVEETEN